MPSMKVQIVAQHVYRTFCNKYYYLNILREHGNNHNRKFLK